MQKTPRREPWPMAREGGGRGSRGAAATRAATRTATQKHGAPGSRHAATTTTPRIQERPAPEVRSAFARAHWRVRPFSHRVGAYSPAHCCCAVRRTPSAHIASGVETSDPSHIRGAGQPRMNSAMSHQTPACKPGRWRPRTRTPPRCADPWETLVCPPPVQRPPRQSRCKTSAPHHGRRRWMERNWPAWGPC